MMNATTPSPLPPRTVECEPILDAREPIRQGDVLELRADSCDPSRRHRIVVTADCDIVHRKHAGALATVPVMRFDAYLATFVAPAKLSATEVQLRQRTRTDMRAMQAKYRDDSRGSMSDDAIDGWIATTAASAVLRTLRADDDPDADALRAQIEWLQGLPEIIDRADLDEQLATLTLGRRLQGDKADESAMRKRLAQESVVRIKQLPGDALFLHSLGDSLCEGYVAYLREIDSLAEHEVAVRQNELLDSEKRALRISRLASPFIFRLTQQLGQVFSSIGLPSSYEESRGLFVDECTSRFGGVQ